MTVQSSVAEIDQILLPNVRDIGDGFEVRRALPTPQRRMVGPFIFLDSFGPVVFRDGQAMDVRPHPHIGLATVTYLLEGAIVHRDSEGYTQTIKPGEVNLMTAGRGIVHSERSGPDVRAHGGTVAGLQSWIALPRSHEETAPGFQHLGISDLPLMEGDGAHVRVVAGTFNGQRAPTNAFSDLFNADVALDDGATFRVDAEHIERGIYIVNGSIEIVGQTGAFGKDRLVVFKPGAEIVLRALGSARLMVFGGEPLGEPRHVFWNFVSSSRERIEHAAEEWRERRFPGVPGDDEFIPLPGMPPKRWS